ncbi:probable polygalacturonase At1g80170 [Impatiens glandulifera]|uniref:probable polygalacturonase At1g80170 n=1 Tax=Impatiens glandulifera TaxID=253017 RepID=UPI001FB0EF7F|nr:probable polygalacturonase At1g80170 [Impatiens glandulifera]
MYFQAKPHSIKIIPLFLLISNPPHHIYINTPYVFTSFIQIQLTITPIIIIIIIIIIMDIKFLFVSLFLFGLLLLPPPPAAAAASYSTSSSSSSSYDDIDIEQVIEEFDFDLEGYPLPEFLHRGKVHVNVDSFGAVGDGVADDTLAFISAWNKSCSTARSVLLVPAERKYLVNATKFKGPCAERFIVQIDGTIVAPNDPKTWDPKLPRTWLEFSNLTGVLFQGSGVIDGSGSNWWAASCKKNKTNPCKGAPTAFTIDSSSAIRVKGLTLKNSQQMHFVVSRCDSVRLSGIEVSSPGDSPNTDGIHITASTNVIMQDCKIGTGDDCISIVNGSSNIKMKTLYCGPGHGISIGSLGKDNSTGIVTKVVLDTAFLRNTTNGLRIKTWQGGSGYVRSIRFQNVRMEDVSNPIIIDQFYCDSPKSCQNQTSAVEISQILYRNISGTSKTERAMNFACSDTVPCEHIVLNNINLQSKDGVAETYCNSVTGFNYGYVQPSAECITSSDKAYVGDEDVELVLKPTAGEDFLHTEL